MDYELEAGAGLSIETDPLREMDDRLDRWARWRRQANAIGMSTGNSPLARLQAEGAEAERGGRALSSKAWASLIAGSGFKREPDYPEEERTEAEIRRLPKHLRTVVKECYLSMLPTGEKAKAMGISERTYWYRLKQAKWELKWSIDALNERRSLHSLQ